MLSVPYHGSRPLKRATWHLHMCCPCVLSVPYHGSRPLKLPTTTLAEYYYILLLVPSPGSCPFYRQRPSPPCAACPAFWSPPTRRAPSNSSAPPASGRT